MEIRSGATTADVFDAGLSVNRPGKAGGEARHGRPDHPGGHWLVPHHKHHRGRVGLLALQLCALAGQVLAVHLARSGWPTQRADLLSIVSMAVMYGSAVWAMTRPHLTRLTRNYAVACLAITPALMAHATDPLLLTGFDEQLHMRTLRDIIASHRLFEPNPVLEISPRYPGLETVTVVFHQLGLPPMVAVVVVILLARLVLLGVLCDAVEHLTHSVRAGGLAVAVYAMSPQFVWFNSQFSYQTLSLPLALAAVSLIGRARQAGNPMPFLGGATVCLLGVAMAHHLTSFLTAGFLLVWTLAERGHPRMRVAYGALAAVSSTVLWAVVQRATLEQYFGPMIHDLANEVGGGVRRQAFKSSAGAATPLLDKVLLLNYAVALSLTALALLVLTLRWQRQRLHDLHYWNPQLLVLAMALALPVLLGARVIPKGVEIFTRSSSFLFLPLSFVVVNYIARLDWWHMARLPHRPPQEAGPHPSRRGPVAHVFWVAAASLVFLGGYVLGSGPSWARLPGPYLPAADSRSMDPETLAAVKWAGESLPAGSRIAADRVSSILLASQAGLWPVYEGLAGAKTPELYVARNWGLDQTDLAGALKIRYVYVDRRMADSLPPFGIYFIDGEVDAGKQLKPSQLDKFDRVPAIKAVYRHGPVSIYDLKGLGLPDYRSGWLGPTPASRPLDQAAVGMMIGLLLAGVIRSRIWPRIGAQLSALRRAFGAPDAAAVLLGAVCLVSAAFILAGVWLTPIVFGCAALVVALANPRATRTALARAASHLTWRGLLAAGSFLVPLAAIGAFSIYDAAQQDIVEVRQILDDPAAVHIPQTATQDGR